MERERERTLGKGERERAEIAFLQISIGFYMDHLMTRTNTTEVSSRGE
jgi:hypothetical protein